MALIDINKTPSRRDLLVFGLLFPVFFGVLGGVTLLVTEDLEAAQVIWAIAGAITLVFALIAPLRVPIYVGWVTLTFPIGWTVSHLLMLLTYYGLLTPLGLIMRLFGRDPMHRRFDASASSYFVSHKPAETSRYFRQF